MLPSAIRIATSMLKRRQRRRIPCNRRADVAPEDTDRRAADQLWPLVYDELRRLAADSGGRLWCSRRLHAGVACRLFWCHSSDQVAISRSSADPTRAVVSIADKKGPGMV
jgi:hypothetical protein